MKTNFSAIKKSVCKPFRGFLTKNSSTVDEPKIKIQVFLGMLYTLLPTVILYSMDAEKLHLGKRAYCTCVKRSLTPKGLVFLNLFLFMVLCLLPLIVQKFGGFSALVEKSVARGRLSLKLF